MARAVYKRAVPSGASARRVGLLFLINLALVGGFRWWAGRFEAPGGPSVLDLELSFTGGVFKQILELWGAAHPQGIQAFKRSVIVLDTLFPPAYAALLSALYTWVARTGGGRPLRTGQIAPWIAAGLDWVENALLLILLIPVHDAREIADTTFAATPVATMSTVAALKLAFIVIPVGLTLVSLCAGPRGRVLARCRFSVLSVGFGSLPLILLPQGRDLLLTLADTTFSGLLARASFFAFLVLWAASVWYWARVLVSVRRDDEPEPTRDERFFATWIPRALGTATLALAAVAFLGAMSIAGRGERESRVMLLFAIACGMLAAAFWRFVRYRREWLARVNPRVDDVTTTYSFARIPAGMRRVAAVSLVVSLTFFALFTASPLTVAAPLGAVTVLLIAAANTVFFGSMAVLFGRRRGLPLVAVALLASAVFSRWNDNHDVRLASAGAASRVAARPGLADAFREWLAPLQAACAGCPDVPVYLVAAEGGGIRAAYWTAGVLTHLQDGRPDFVRHLFAISGVSGGSVGATVFASLVRDGAAAPLPCSGGMDGRATLEPCARAVLSRPFLTPTLAKMVTGDVAQWFLPVAFPAFDRARALEGSWMRAYRAATGRETLAAPYLESWPGPAAGLPALILNGTHVQTGRRVIATPFSWTSADIPDAYDHHLLLGADVPLATAMHNSARFSYVSPAGHLRTTAGEDRGYVVDGGYFENSGAATLNDVLHALRRAPVGPGPPPRFVVIYLCNSPERCFVPAIDVAGDTAWRPAANMAEWFSPLRALLGAREARGRAALAELRREVGPESFVELGVCRRLTNQERMAPLPLGWQISERVRSEMDRQVQDPVCGAAPIP